MVKSRRPSRLLASISLASLALAAATVGAQTKPPAVKPVPATTGTIGKPVIVPPTPAKLTPPKADELWVGGSTDELIAQLEKRAIRDGLAGGSSAIGAIMTIPQLADEAKGGAARASLLRIAKALEANAASKELAMEAATIARAIAPDAGAAAGRSEDAKVGLVPVWQIVGPFKDTQGTGLMRAEGPEVSDPNAAAATPTTKKPKEKAEDKPRPVSVDLFRQLDQTWDDGPYQVNWRPVEPALISARGIPLEALVYPRRESCSYLATTLTLKKDETIVVRVAASGSVRGIFDGGTFGSSEEDHALALADRLATKIDAAAGMHLLAFKVCSGPNADAGRFHARVTTAAHGAVADIKFSDDLSKLPAALTPPKFTALQTPLAKALAAGDATGGSVDDALAAALARRMGGADDLRSPKAQGLLDVVVSSAPRPDVLAMAGWLAPSRGHVTQWLNRALDAAKKDATYDAVAKFALRVLVDARLDAGYVDWAASTIASTELQKATDLDAQQLRARLLEVLGRSEDAFNAWKGMWDAQKLETPTAVLRAISRYTEGHPIMAGAALEQAFSIWPRESPTTYARSKALLGADKVKEAVKASFRAVQSAEDIMGLAQIMKGAGLHEEYRQFLAAMALQWTPNNKSAWSELAQMLAGSTEGNDKEDAKKALGRALELDPGSPFLRAEATLAVGEEHPDDEQYIPKPEVFLARRKGAPKDQSLLDVYDRQLDWVRVVTVDDAGRVAQLVHYTREIVKPIKDASDLDEPNVPAEGDVVEVVIARVHRADGGIAVPQEIDEGNGIGIRWTDLKPGDVVEVATRGHTELPIGDRSAAPFFFMDYAGGPQTHPVLYDEVVVRSPKKKPLFTALIHEEAGKPDIHTNEVDPKSGRTVERYVWNNPIALPEEPLQPRASEIYPTVIGSQFKTWDDFVTWYKAGVSSFESVDPRIKREAEDIVKKAKATTRDQKLAAVFDWVADKVKYVNYQSAEQWLPNRPQNVLDRMQGDCDDKAMLLMTMLKAVGITEAQEVLVQTRYTGMPSIITAKGAVAPMFDHGIAFLPGPGGKGDRYLDATSPESRLGPLPGMDARAAAIRVNWNGPTPIVTLPASDPSEHGYDAKWAIALHDDGSADIATDETHMGDSAFWLRTALKEKSAAAPWLEKYHAIARLPQIEVLPEGIVFDGEQAQGKAKLKFKARSQALARREGTDLVLALSFGETMVDSLAPLVKRKTPVTLPPNMAPSEEIVRAEIVVPAGYKLADLTAGGEVDGGAYGKASLKIEKGAKGGVVVTRTLAFDKSNIPLAEYDAWRGFLQQIDALFRREVRFVKG